MARARGGNTGFAVALVIFGCAFVISTLVAIILYTKIEAAKAGEDTAIKEKQKYVRDSETGAANDFVSPDASVFANMKARMTAIEEELRLAKTDVTKLTAQVSNQNAAATSLVNEKEDVESRLNAEREQYATIMQERQDKIDSLLAEKQTLVDQIAALQASIDGKFENADAAAKERIAELNEKVGTLETNVTEATKLATDWERQYKLLLDSLPTPPTQNTTLPDATIASVFDNGNSMFITLGRDDGLVIGMTFEIFDPLPVIRLTTEGAARGKATVEVYGLEPDTATVRLVRIEPGEKVDPGDPIVNLGYDPNMEIKMIAFGQFDIESDGGTNDIKRIEALIINSGATLGKLGTNKDGDPVLTPDIDYIVMGARPELPEAPPADTFDPEAIKRYQELLKQNEAYFRVLDDAKILRIPVLNQNRFLQLTGYYQR